MAAKGKLKKDNAYFVAVDVGGTKILGVVADRHGVILARERLATPRSNQQQDVMDAIEEVIAAVLRSARLNPGDVAATGVAIPGVVDPKNGVIVRTPNSCLSGAPLVPRLERKFGCQVALGNDCNFGALGETWLGAARKARSMIGIFVGTGIGAGFAHKRKIWRGAREVACEIGHIVMEMGGPLCGCGNRGCFEALAGRNAIERDIREAVARGESTILMELLNGDLSVIRSKALKQALECNDPLVTRVMQRAAEVIGYACLTVRHLIDPEWIVLGGGVMEACGDLLWERIQSIIHSDQLPGACNRGGICLSALGDDAVVLGAVAYAAKRVGVNVFKAVRKIKYPQVDIPAAGKIRVNGREFTEDVLVFSDGRVKGIRSVAGEEHKGLLTEDLPSRLIRGGIETLFIGLGSQVPAATLDPVYHYCARRRISVIALPTVQAVAAFERSKARRAAYFYVS